MRIQEAVRLRILQLCHDKNMTVNHLAEVSGGIALRTQVNRFFLCSRQKYRSCYD